MGLRSGASDRLGHESARSVCWHARGEPATPDTSERLSNSVPRLLCAVSLWPAEGPSLWRGYATQHRGEQPLQRLAVNGRQAARSRASGTGKLHLEPLHGHRLKGRIPALLRGRHYLAPAGTARAPIRLVRLLCPAQLHDVIQISVTSQGPESDARLRG